AQACCVVQIIGLAAAGRPNLEDHSDHRLLSYPGFPKAASSRESISGHQRLNPQSLEAHAIRWAAPQRIRNERIVGWCFGRGASGPATILSLARCGLRAIVPLIFAAMHGADQRRAQRSSAMTTETADMLIIDRPDDLPTFCAFAYQDGNPSLVTWIDFWAV